ncbi:hypothetical protein KEJ19_05885 [Candidatus Bathyarchaeota archaeon]|nr:hypothetical protein [Candidatus Bathyarchaeota archaeon]
MKRKTFFLHLWLLIFILSSLLFALSLPSLLSFTLRISEVNAQNPGTNLDPDSDPDSDLGIEPIPQPEVELIHKVEIFQGGSILVNDSLILRNPGIQSIDSFVLGFPEEFKGYLDHFFAYDDLGERLSLENESLSLPGIFAFRIRLSKALLPMEETRITILLVFSRIISFSTSLQRYEIQVFLNPILSFNLSRFSSEIAFPKTLTPVNYPENLTLVVKDGRKALILNASSNLQSFTSYKAKISFQGNLQVLSIKNLRRRVEVSMEGVIRVFDDYQIENPIAKKVSSVNVTLGKGAKGIAVEDSLGPLAFTERALNKTLEGMEGVEVQLNLRDEIGLGELASFTVSYELPRHIYASSGGGVWNQVLSLRLPFGFKAKVVRLLVQFILPEQAQFLNASSNLGQGILEVVSGIASQSRQVIFWNAKEVSFLEEPSFLVSYAHSILWSTLQPMVFTLLIAILAYGFLQYRPKAPPERVAPGVSLEAVKGFIEACGRYMELELEFDRLRDEFDRRKIGSSQYRKMTNVLNERKRETERTLLETGNTLRKLGGRYENIVVEIEEAKAQMETIRMSLENLRDQYRLGRISRVVYERLLREYSRRLEGERTKVRRNLEALRG